MISSRSIESHEASEATHFYHKNLSILPTITLPIYFVQAENVSGLSENHILVGDFVKF